jgi:MFS family permease
MTLFWTLFDGSMGLIAPVLLEKSFSTFTVGIILGSGPLFGSFFDILLSNYFKHPDFRRIFIYMFLSCLGALFFLWNNQQNLILFLISMAFWGLYFDLNSFGTQNLVKQNYNKQENTSVFGIIQTFGALGYTLAPLIVGLIFIDKIEAEAIFVFLLFLAASLIFFIFTGRFSKVNLQKAHTSPSQKLKSDFRNNLKSWKKLAIKIHPYLIGSSLICLIDSAFWLIGPLLSAKLIQTDPLGAFLMFAFSFPFLFAGFLVVKVPKINGKKIHSVFALLLLTFLVITASALNLGTIFLLAVFFISSLFGALIWPILDSAYADLILDNPSQEKDLEGIKDFAENISYFLGTALAGLSLEFLAHTQALSFLSLIYLGIVVVVVFRIKLFGKIESKKMVN